MTNQESTSADASAIDRRLDCLKTELRTLKDQIRVDLHLAGMDLRDEWRRLERRLPEASDVAEGLKETAAEVLEGLSRELRDFRQRLSRQQDSQPRP
jgi:hypothetical protein